MLMVAWCMCKSKRLFQSVTQSLYFETQVQCLPSYFGQSRRIERLVHNTEVSIENNELFPCFE